MLQASETERRGPSPSASDPLLRAVLESPPDIVIFALDRRYRYLAFNENHRHTMKAIWGVDIALGCSMLDFIGRADDRDRARANFGRALAGEAFTLVEEYGDEAMSRRHYENVYSPITATDGEVVGLTLFLTDITEQRARDAELAAYRERLETLVAERSRALAEAQRRLGDARKLESLGLLAGGVAHDFNNLLVSVLGHAELALAELPDGAVGRDHLLAIKDTARRAGALTDQMLAYSGRGRRDRRPFDLAVLVTELIPSLRAALPANIDLELQLDPGAVVVSADRTQLGQVITNLVANARDAIGARRGRVTLRCSRITPEAARDLRAAGDLPEAVEDPHVLLEVRDDGRGMTPDTLARVFDPFFTTKPAGRGLGLAASLGIVRSHGGLIAVDSAPGRGACFRVVLPAEDVAEQAEAPRASPTSAVDRGWRGEGTVLVAEDDPTVRAVAVRLLERAGFATLEASDGATCVAAFTAHRDDVRAVLLDLTMPGLTGAELIARLRSVSTRVPIVLFTGHSDLESELLLASGQLAAWLKKPFDLATLVTTMRRVIEQG